MFQSSGGLFCLQDKIYYWDCFPFFFCLRVFKFIPSLLPTTGAALTWVMGIFRYFFFYFFQFFLLVMIVDTVCGIDA